MVHKHRSWTLALCFSIFVVFVSGLVAVMVGSHSVNLQRALQGLSPDREILVQLRIPRALLALWDRWCAGSSPVSCSKLCCGIHSLRRIRSASREAHRSAQCLPSFSAGTALGIFRRSACRLAWVSAAVLLLLVGISSDGGKMSSIGLLLAGVTIETMCGAAILLLSNLVGFLKSFSVTRWLMGGIDAPAYSTLLWLTVVLAPVCCVVFWYSREWNLLAVGETWAATRGLSTNRLLLIGCIAGSILTGAVTALTGPIGFRWPHRAPCAAYLAGRRSSHSGTLFVPAGWRFSSPCATSFSRTILAPVEIPVGVITALLGGPLLYLDAAQPP